MMKIMKNIMKIKFSFCIYKYLFFINFIFIIIINMSII